MLKYFVIPAKIVVGTSLLAVIINYLDVNKLSGILTGADKGLLMLAIVSHLLAFLVMNYRWWYILKLNHPEIPLTKTLGSYYLGLFCNNFLPTAIGGDVVRIVRLKRMGMNTSGLISSSLLDRYIGLYSILVLGISAMYLVSEKRLFVTSHNTLFLILMALASGVFIIKSEIVYRYLKSVFTSKNRNLFKVIWPVLDSLFQYKNKISQLIIIIFISLIAQCLITLCYILISMSLHIDISQSLYFILVPISYLATSIPISIGGLGVREGVLVSLMTYYGVDLQSAISVSIVYFSILVFTTLPAGLMLVNNSYLLKQQSIGTSP